ncbi:hypothetical protein LSCM1_07659 [Leishmania martiniquensis]|uniref:F-box domain-containing protein n=1 Tax=Leishmania martiniquensis TaxID=1580590 RepID=A0A836KWM5_9TRYP|nr:hypothetical protein LSCM1_07659 [Leishmania martiniquensis]
MDFWRRTTSLDSIGVVYSELEPRPPDVAVARSVSRDRSERHAVASALTPPPNVARIDDVFSETSTTAETRTYSSSCPVTTSTVRMHHLREASGDFTFTGQPRAVVHFRSCITANDARSRLYARAGRGNDGDAKKKAEAVLPQQTGPFSADIVCIILLYVDTSTHADIVQLGSVCRFWRFYANLAPHWTYFRRREWRKQADLPRYVRRIVAKTKIVTRDEYIRERMKVEEYKKKEHLIGTAKHIRWCFATGIMVGVMLTANFVVAYFLGFLRTALRSDVHLGITAFVVLIVMTLLEVTLVIFPLAGSSISGTNKRSTMRILAWGLLMLVCSMYLGTISALAFTRVQASQHVLDGPTIDLTMSAQCEAYSSQSLPSFVLVPAELSDLRWRPLTLDKSERRLVPYCVQQWAGGDDKTSTCFVLLYFDANYSSAVFQNESALLAGRDVGTRYANSFDPFSVGQHISGLWCNTSGYPQVVALSQIVYLSVEARRKELYPATADWLDPSRRPSAFSRISLRCSSSINREETENPIKSTEVWYHNGVLWKWNYVPLVTTHAQVRRTFQRDHRHFLYYAFSCHIIAAVLWAAMLFAQMIFRMAASVILGVATAAALVLLNPLTMVVSGTLCVTVSDTYFMCDAASGGALIGGGIGLTFLLLAIYVTVRE